METLSLNQSKFDYDYIVIGGGSGGLASARRAASYGSKVALIEQSALGGTCVNVGCVPKKVMWNTSDLAEALRDSKDYGFSFENLNFEWKKIKEARDAYIGRLHTIYESLLDKAKVETLSGTAKFTAPHSISVNGKIITGEHILIATGGRPAIPKVPGAELGITSDGFFQLESIPKTGTYIVVIRKKRVDIIGKNRKILWCYYHVAMTWQWLEPVILRSNWREF